MSSGFYSSLCFPPLILILCFDLLLPIPYNGSAGSKSGLRSGTELLLSGPVKRAVAPAANSRAGLSHNGGFCCWRMCLRSNPWHWGHAQGPRAFCFIILLNVTVGRSALGQLEVAAGRTPEKGQQWFVLWLFWLEEKVAGWDMQRAQGSWAVTTSRETARNRNRRIDN